MTHSRRGAKEEEARSIEGASSMAGCQHGWWPLHDGCCLVAVIRISEAKKEKKKEPIAPYNIKVIIGFCGELCPNLFLCWVSFVVHRSVAAAMTSRFTSSQQVMDEYHHLSDRT
jgi:hypothetical protein